MVDAQYAQLTDKVVAAIRKISPGPIRYLVNTHIHPDHTAGNANFVKMGALIFAREELREEMLRRAGAKPPAAPVGDPAGFLSSPIGWAAVKLHMNGEMVDLIPVWAAHTGGDTMIRFENANVIMIGDFYRNYGYPFIDTNNGGSLKGMLEGLEVTMKPPAEHQADPRPRHHHQARRHRSLSGHDPGGAGKSAADDREGKSRAGGAGRESHRSL